MTITPAGAAPNGHIEQLAEQCGELLEWSRLPVCAASGQPEMWDDTIDGEEADERAERCFLAARVCASCPVVSACARAAENTPVEFRSGIWAARLYRLGWDRSVELLGTAAVKSRARKVRGEDREWEQGSGTDEHGVAPVCAPMPALTPAPTPAQLRAKYRPADAARERQHTPPHVRLVGIDIA